MKFGQNRKAPNPLFTKALFVSAGNKNVESVFFLVFGKAPIIVILDFFLRLMGERLTENLQESDFQQGKRDIMIKQESNFLCQGDY